MRLQHCTKIVFAAALLLYTVNVYAFSNNQERIQYSADQIAALAKKVERAGAARGARVFILSRVGRPPAELPEGVNFTHAAFAVYSRIKTSDGRTVPGYAIYNLYQDDETPATSNLVQDYPLDYFAGVHALRSGVIIPNVALQKRLLQVISSDAYQKAHNSRYSVLSNPNDLRLQNCTEFVVVSAN